MSVDFRPRCDHTPVEIDPIAQDRAMDLGYGGPGV
jgi:hypothetical protein